jgi:hypothetical protein
MRASSARGVSRNSENAYFNHGLLRCALEAAMIGRIQYLPISVFLSNGSAIAGYCIANFLDLVPALDLQKSNYTRYGSDWAAIDPMKVGRISGLRRGVLVGTALVDRDVIRLQEFWPVYYVSRRFKDSFESNRCTGYEFIEVRVSWSFSATCLPVEPV